VTPTTTDETLTPDSSSRSTDELLAPLDTSELFSTGGGTSYLAPPAAASETLDSSSQAAHELLALLDASEPFSAGGRKAHPAPAAAASEVPALLPPGLGRRPHSFGTPPDADPTEGIDDAMVMQGIDTRYTAQSLLEEIYHSGFLYGRDIQLFHLPCDATGASLGCCYLVFDTVSTRNQFIVAWHGKRMRLAQASETVSLATITAKDVLSLLTEHSEVILEDDPTAWSLFADRNEAGPASPTVVEQTLPGVVAKFCTSCGGRVNIRRGDKFCAACGAPVRGA
jgi:hypothetical protein